MLGHDDFTSGGFPRAKAQYAAAVGYSIDSNSRIARRARRAAFERTVFRRADGFDAGH
jgi:hypothetical protein